MLGELFSEKRFREKEGEPGVEPWGAGGRRERSEVDQKRAQIPRRQRRREL